MYHQIDNTATYKNLDSIKKKKIRNQFLKSLNIQAYINLKDKLQYTGKRKLQDIANELLDLYINKAFRTGR